MQTESTPQSPGRRRGSGRRGNNEGSIYQVTAGRQAGLWRGSVTLADGTRKYLSGETREEVAKKVAHLLAQTQRGGYVKTDDRTTVGTVLTHWLLHAKRTTRPRTFAFYEGHVRLYLAPALGTRRLTQLTPMDIEVMLTGLTGIKRVSPRTARHALVTLRTALNRAMKWGLVAHNAAALTDPPKQRKAPISPLTVDQARALLDGAEGHRLHSLLTVALTTGLRAGELLGLRWEDVDLKRGTLSVRHALEAVSKQRRADPAEALTAEERARGWRLVEPKSESSKRTLPLLPLARAALGAQRTRVLETRLAAGQRWEEQDGGGFVFPSAVGTPIGYRNMVREYAELLAAAGLPPKRFHDLRHTTATFLLAAGASPRLVMEVLGHSQISLTMNTYSHVQPALLGETMAKLEALFSGGPPAAAPG